MPATIPNAIVDEARKHAAFYSQDWLIYTDGKYHYLAASQEAMLSRKDCPQYINLQAAVSPVGKVKFRLCPWIMTSLSAPSTAAQHTD